SVSQMQGSMSLKNAPDPHAFERAHYIQAVSGHEWHGQG
ncbi:MAG: dihydroorotate dehydrogenase-like protein, partial [Deltaproteobacteria bacterium]